MYKDLLDKIIEYDDIVIFRHIKPDGDCMFSALALFQFIKDNFKNKKVKIAGEEIYDIISRNDKVSDNFIRKALVIVVDTATGARIDDQRYQNGAYIIKIDHHPIIEQYGDLNIVDSSAASCTQILASIFFSKAFKDLYLSEKVCEYLYCGLVTDTINLRTTNTASRTLSIASKLVKRGQLNISDLVEYVTDIDLDTYQKVTRIRTHLQVKEHFGYIILDETDLQALGMSGTEAKNNIDEIGKIKDLNIWAFAVENKSRYDVSVRSKRGYKINDSCSRYKGGGHANAAAAKQLEKGDLDALFQELVELSTK